MEALHTGYHRQCLLHLGLDTETDLELARHMLILADPTSAISAKSEADAYLMQTHT